MTNPFVRTRQARHSEVVEDYVELIAELAASRGEARAADIARTLGVTHATVAKTIARLVRDGYATTKPYRAIELTAQGRSLADLSRKRHEIVYEFLRAIGVAAETARTDAEGIEHHVSEQTLAAFQTLTKRLNDPRG